MNLNMDKSFLDFIQAALWLDHGESFIFELNSNKYHLVRHNLYDDRVLYVTNLTKDQYSNTLLELTPESIQRAIDEIIAKEIHNS
jgi:hypothetical protein